MTDGVSDRFYAPGLAPDGPAVLADSEAHHLRDVLRLGIGDRVVLFDGNGSEATAEITAVDRNRIELSVGELRCDPDPAPPELVLATAIPKGDRFRWLVEKATELGIDRLVPLKTDRSIVHPGTGKQRRMQLAVIAACKQCGRNRLMQFDDLTTFDDLLSRCRSDSPIAMAQQGGGPGGDFIRTLADSNPQRIILAVGPEGGWTDEELARANQIGAATIDLGRHVLRTDTAAVALAAIARTLAGE